MEDVIYIGFEDITDENRSAVTDIYNYYVTNTTASYAIEPVTPKEFTDYYKISDSRTLSKAVTVSGEVVGFFVLKPWNPNKRAYEHTYEFTEYLKNGFCHKGVGSAAYRYAEKYIAEKGIKAVMAAICSENEASCRLVESLGFEKCGHLKNVGQKFGRNLDLYYYEKMY